MKIFHAECQRRMRGRFARLYGDAAASQCVKRLEALVGRYGVGDDLPSAPAELTQKDAFLIAYGDMVSAPGRTPLAALRGFLDRHVRRAFSTLHVLPFFPYSSDDGFSVVDYRQVHPALGTWDDVEALAGKRRVMFDLVLNHASRQSKWFRDYTMGLLPERDFFVEAPPDADLSAVVRPRTSSLLSPVQTRDGQRHVWTTFSEDQVDLNFANPDVLFEFLDILFFYVSKGAGAVRLDAIAYLWKRIGTPCIHLPETHEVVKLLRDVTELVAPHVLLITETNVPHEENVSYFGEGDEAHMVYQFTLPPLLLYALQTGNAARLREWAAGLGDLPPGQAFLNFTASHDGIGVRPLEGILSHEEVAAFADGAERRGGFVSRKANPDGTESPYELNITYFDALRDPDADPDPLHVQRFLCSQVVSLALKGVPAIYFNSLVAAPNWNEGAEKTGRARTVNRRKWQEEELEAMLGDPGSDAAKALKGILRALSARAKRPAFHPAGAQRLHDMGDGAFVVERVSPDGAETVVSASNFTARPLPLALGEAVPALKQARSARNLLNGTRLTNRRRALTLGPYETAWLKPEGTRG